MVVDYAFVKYNLLSLNKFFAASEYYLYTAHLSGECSTQESTPGDALDFMKEVTQVSVRHFVQVLKTSDRLVWEIQPYIVDHFR